MKIGFKGNHYPVGLIQYAMFSMYITLNYWEHSEVQEIYYKMKPHYDYLYAHRLRA